MEICSSSNLSIGLVFSPLSKYTLPNKDIKGGEEGGGNETFCNFGG